MNVRVEVTEEQWVGGLRQADYVAIDLSRDQDRPWLEEAAASVELIGRSSSAADAALVDRALALDVDFIALGEVADDLDARRLPLRLIVEQPVGEVGESPDLFGAAWARRIVGWRPGDRDALADLARRERIFLGARADLPDAEWLAAVAPFAVAVPQGCDPAEIARIRGL